MPSNASGKYDAIVIGGGHNGLVNAAYLARAGKKVLVLERRHVLGGAACTEEIIPGFKFSVCSYVVSLLRPEIIRDLDLPRHGLEILPLDGTFTPMPNGDYLWRVNDHGKTMREIRRHSRFDAEAYEEFGKAMLQMCRFVKPILSMVPPDPTTLNPRDLLKLLFLGRRFQGLSGEDKYNQVQLMTMSAIDFLDQWFETDVLKATMSASGIIGTFLGVRSPGTAYVLLHHYMGEIDGAFRAWGFSGMASKSIDVSSVIGGIFGGVSHQVAKHYRDCLFGNTTLQDLPDDPPRFVFNSTSLQTGVLWRFSKPFMGDWMVGRVMNPTLDLATAVAASSAFPPVLSPAVLELDPNSFKNDDVPPPRFTTPDFRKEVVLTDGGVYDNLGLETAWKRCTTILVSDGGGSLGMQSDPARDYLGQAHRVLDVIDNQVGALRKRTLIAAYESKIREGTYWGIRTNIANYAVSNALQCDFNLTQELAATATRLTALDAGLQHQLIDWGYAVCDAAMRRHVVPQAPAPTQSPFGTFKQATALGATGG